MKSPSISRTILLCFTVLGFTPIYGQETHLAYYTVHIDQSKLDNSFKSSSPKSERFLTYTVAIDRSKSIRDLQPADFHFLEKTSLQRYSSLKADNLKGQILSIEQTRHTPDPLNNALQQDSCCVFKMEYANGNLLKRASFTTQGILNDFVACTYHHNGLLKEQTFYNKDNKITYREVFDIDANGNYVGGKMYNEAGELHRNVKIEGQNAFGQWTKVILYTASGTLYRTEEYTYEGNKLLSTLWTDQNGKVIRDDQTRYDQNGQPAYFKMINTQFPIANGEIFQRTDTYDQYGNWTQRSILDANGQVSKVVKRQYTYK